MTCIVGKPGHIASDSRETGEIKRSCSKFFRKHEYFVGVAGDSANALVIEHVLSWPRELSVDTVTRWIHKHHDPPYVDFDTIDLLFVCRRFVLVVTGRAVHPPGVVGAVGSGAPWAQGYLEARPADLKGAVVAACRFDPWCAGPVRTDRLKK